MDRSVRHAFTGLPTSMVYRTWLLIEHGVPDWVISACRQTLIPSVMDPRDAVARSLAEETRDG